MSSPKVIVDATPVVKVSYGLPGPGIPKGGSFPKVLKKSSSTDYDAEWGYPNQVYLDESSYNGIIGGPTSIAKVLRQPPTSDQLWYVDEGTVVGVWDPSAQEVIVFGILEGVDTSSFGYGDVLYAGGAGALTNVVPSEDAFQVGFVVGQPSSSGKIFVTISNADSSPLSLAQNKIWVGDSNGLAAQVDAVLASLTDVSSSMSPSNGEILRYQSGEWNSSSLTLSDTGLAQLTAKHIYVGDSNNETVPTDVLNVDVANSRVGIVEQAPSEALGVYGRIQLGDVTGSVMIGGSLPASSGNLNVIVGFEAAGLANSFSNTVAVGARAALRQTGENNVAIGSLALGGPNSQGATGSGDDNVAIGFEALKVSNTAFSNVAVGYQALRSATTGNGNVAVGREAGGLTTTAIRSTYIGQQAGFYANGDENTALGYAALQGGLPTTSTFQRTVAVGVNALGGLTSGSQNTALGYSALSDLTTGSRNTAVGYQANYSTQTSSQSTAIGNETVAQIGATAVGDRADGASYSTAVGHLADAGSQSVAAGYLSATSNFSVAVGSESVSRLDSVSIGYKAGNNLGGSSQGRNTLVGWSAGRGDSSATAQYNNNTAIGWSAGRLLDSGSGNVLIGYAAGFSLTDESNQLHINNSEATEATPLIYGEFDNQYVKINGSLEVTSSGKIGTTLEVVGDIISTNDEDITLMPDGVGHVVMGNYEFDVDQAVGQATDDYILAYDDSDGTIRLKENIIEVTGATSVTTPIQNNETVVIPAGTPVYAMGETQGGARTLVGIADASDPSKMPAIGIAATDLQPTGPDEDGDAIVMGDFDVTITAPYSGLEPNDVLYVAVGGGLPTQTKPTGASNLIQNIGVVLKTNGASGTQCKALKVSCIGRSNDVPNIAENNAWVGNASGVAVPTTLADVAFSGDYGDLSNTPTDEHIANTDLTLDADRVLTQSTNRLQFVGVDVNGASVTMLDSNPGAANGASLLLHDNSIIVGSQSISANKLSFFREDLQVGDGQTAGGSVGFRSTAIAPALFGNTIFIKAPTQLANNDTYILPSSQPSSTQFLSSDSVGNMSWATPVDTNTNIGNSNLSLTSARTLAMGHDLSFQDSSGTNKLKYIQNVDTWQFGGAKVQFFTPAEFYNTPLITTTSGPGSLDISGSSGILPGRVRLTAPSGMTSTVTFTLPDADGTPGQFLSTDGSGNLSFATGGTGTGDNIGNSDLTLSDNRVLEADGSDFQIRDGSTTVFGWASSLGGLSINATNTLITSALGIVGDTSITGRATFKGSSSAAAGKIFINDNDDSNSVSITVPASLSGDVDLVLPGTDGSPNQVLKTDGSGNLDWVDQTAIPALNLTQVSGSGSLGRIPFYSSSPQILDSDADLSFSSNTLSTPRISVERIVPTRPLGSSAAGTFGSNSQTTSKLGGNVSVSLGLVYSMQSGSFARSNGRQESTASGMLAVAGAGGASPSTTFNTPMVLNGFVKVASNAEFSSASVGDPLYLHPTNNSAEFGRLTATAPSVTGNAVRIVGYVSDPTNGIVYFNPDNSYIVL